jgi:hypothetical protein
MPVEEIEQDEFEELGPAPGPARILRKPGKIGKVAPGARSSYTVLHSPLHFLLFMEDGP